jgi:ankyrin repeat protein
VQLLLKHKADVDANNNGRTAKNGHEAVVQLLLKHMADVDAKHNDERTAIHQAAENEH